VKRNGNTGRKFAHSGDPMGSVQAKMKGIPFSCVSKMAGCASCSTETRRDN